MDYSAQFLDSERLGGDVMLFHAEKPDGFRFLPGQFCFVTVPNAGFQDDRGLRRPISIASSPLEARLLFVTKVSGSAFKRTLAGLSSETAIGLEKPLGSFVLPKETATPLVFLAGGVGIAPFRSMMRYTADAPTGHTVTLFYSSRVPEETPFLDELRQMSEIYGKNKVIVTMTRAGEGQKPWAGRTGRVSAEMIMEECDTWATAVYYIAGPPNMVQVIRQTLEGMNVPPERIKTELFGGY